MPTAQLWDGEAWGPGVARTIFPITLVADGSDQSSSLASQIALVPEGTEEEPNVIRLPEGEYRIDAGLTLTNREWLTLEGPTAGEFLMYSDSPGDVLGIVDGNGNSTREHVVIQGCTGVTLRRMHVRGPNNEREPADTRFAKYRENRAFEMGVAVQGASDQILVEDFTVTDVYGDAYYLGGTGDQNTDVTFRNCIGRYAGRQAIGCVNCDGALFEDVDVQWNGRSGFDVEPNHDTHFVFNLTLRRVTMGPRFYPFILGGDAGDSGIVHVSDVLMEDCVGVNSASNYHGILANARTGHNVTIRGHLDLRNRAQPCIQLGNWTGVVLVEDCRMTSISVGGTAYAVAFSSCGAADRTIRNCNFNFTGGVSTNDELYTSNTPGLDAGNPIAHCGNTWSMDQDDGVCP